MQIFVSFIFSCFRPSNRAGPSPNARVLAAHPPLPRSLPTIAPDAGDDTLIQAIMNLDRGFVFRHIKSKMPHFILLGNRYSRKRCVSVLISLTGRSGTI